MIYIITIGVFQSLLLILLMLSNKNKKSVHFLITGLLLFVFVHLGIKFIIYSNVNTGIFKKGFTTFIDLAYGPLIWMIARKVKDDNYSLAKHWYFFLPALVAAIFFFGIIISALITGAPPENVINPYNSITGFALLPLLLGFSIAAYKTSIHIRNFWSTERQLIRNVSVLFIMMSVLITIGLLYPYFINTPQINLMLVRSIFYGLLVVVCIAILRYFIISQAENNVTEKKSETSLPLQTTMKLQQPIPLISGVNNDAETNTTFELIDEAKAMHTIEENNKIIQPESGFQKKHTLNSEQQKAIIETLQTVMRNKKLYTDPDLDLTGLSEAAKISRHHVSEVLNQYAGKSFYEFINGYRVEEMLVILDKCKINNIKPNILPIAFEAGFNSKSSFNLYFKKHTGLTPSEYLKREEKAKEIQPFSPMNSGFIQVKQTT
jgi:AraC-like DNA-binding protein